MLQQRRILDGLDLLHRPNARCPARASFVAACHALRLRHPRLSGFGALQPRAWKEQTVAATAA
jgi:hypothetical protein